MPSLPPRLLQDRSPSPPSSLKPRLDPTILGVPDDTVKATQKQIDAYHKWYDGLPKEAQKKIDKFQKDHGLTQDQLILAALKKWAPQYVGPFKMAMFFGIV
ncbi:uncharacterized protein EAF02_006276 [Botrytis sinoallii]|uniref:uncharacterized protein n=1 Tax=Botrytis sinoallii TaxID=1463999 RepID=UPI0018FF7E82|nr:uncharacterized protein EAF02_006276 [Botrytis sinoallii]KAF7881588.1 hypothetical protein EAF02_006276 [Botrytis sinoallii]